MIDYLLPLRDSLEANADPATAAPMAKYMRDQFPFLGIKSPLRRTLYKNFLAQHSLPPPEALDPIVKELWQLPQREYQYVAMDLLDRMKKHVTPDFLPLLEHLIVTKSWWDTVDGLAGHGVGGLFLRHPQARNSPIAAWRTSDNFWLRRTTLLFQLRYKAETDQGLLFSLINDNLGSDEFFINKAIG